MRNLAVLFLVLFFYVGYSQKGITVYTHNGSKYVGTCNAPDSANRMLKVKIQGGSEFNIPFGEIDSVHWTKAISEIKYGKPYFGFCLGVAMNSKKNIFQLDMVTGYHFNSRWSAGIGYSITEYSSLYVSGNYYPYKYKYISAGIYLQAGIVLTPFYNWDYNYYGGDPKLSGFYSNNGISIRFNGQSNRYFVLNLGYQYIKKVETYNYWNGEKPTFYYYFNRYILQGVYTF